MSDFLARLQRALDADFLIERELGGAGMSRVFVAMERALQRRVVIKVLPPELAAGVNVERFRREIQLAAQLQHPHIVPLLAAGDDQGLLWFSMPFIEGESLRGTLTRQGRLATREVIRILHDVLDALAYAHARGVVHRDIKPDNILTSAMHALVTDFGVAKALSAASPASGGTGTGMAIGTPAYMAPEQLAADPAMDHRVDLYAVGLLAYELLTGKSPFSGASPQATLAAQLTQIPEPPHRAIAGIPESLSTLIMQCLEKDADQRPASATQLIAQLEAVGRALPAPRPPAHDRAATRPRRLPVPPRRRAWLAAGALGVSLVTWAVSTDSWRLRTPPAGEDTLGTAAKGAAVAARDTVPVYRDVADAAPRVSMPLVLTRAESLAIADAVRTRQPRTKTAAAATAAVNPETLLAEVGRVFADSMNRALQRMDSTLASLPRVTTSDRPRTTQSLTPLVAPPTDARLRLVIAPYTNASGRRGLAPAALAMTQAMAQALRDGIAVNRFDVLSDSLTRLATRTLPDRMAIGWGLRADYVISGMISERTDSVVVLTTLTDVRSGRYSRLFESVAPAADMMRAVDPAQRQVRAWLDTAAAISARRRSR